MKVGMMMRQITSDGDSLKKLEEEVAACSLAVGDLLFKTRESLASV